MTHTDAIQTIEKHFLDYADNDIINEIHEEQIIPQKLPFKRFYHLYQDKHRAKYGEYLQIPLKSN